MATVITKRELIGAPVSKFQEYKEEARQFLSENGMYDTVSTYATAIAEFLLWKEGLSIRLTEGETESYSKGKALAQKNLDAGRTIDMNTSPSANNEEFNNGYWDYIAEEKRKLQAKLEMLTG